MTSARSGNVEQEGYHNVQVAAYRCHRSVQAWQVHWRVALPLLLGALIQQDRAQVRRAIHHAHIALRQDCPASATLDAEEAVAPLKTIFIALTARSRSASECHHRTSAISQVFVTKRSGHTCALV